MCFYMFCLGCCKNNDRKKLGNDDKIDNLVALMLNRWKVDMYLNYKVSNLSNDLVDRQKKLFREKILLSELEREKRIRQINKDYDFFYKGIRY